MSGLGAPEILSPGRRRKEKSMTVGRANARREWGRRGTELQFPEGRGLHRPGAGARAGCCFEVEGGRPGGEGDVLWKNQNVLGLRHPSWDRTL